MTVTVSTKTISQMLQRVSRNPKFQFGMSKGYWTLDKKSIISCTNRLLSWQTFVQNEHFKDLLFWKQSLLNNLEHLAIFKWSVTLLELGYLFENKTMNEFFGSKRAQNFDKNVSKFVTFLYLCSGPNYERIFGSKWAQNLEENVTFKRFQNLETKLRSLTLVSTTQCFQTTFTL